MPEPSGDPPESQRFDEFIEIAVDGKPVFRAEQADELRLSDIDDAVIAFFAKAIFEEANEELKEEYGKGVEEILNEREPEVLMYQSGVDTWEDLFEQVNE